MQIGLIGCGNMGGGMARHMLSSGCGLVCYDPSPTIREDMQTAGAEVTSSEAEVARAVEIVILSLPKAPVVESVMAVIAPHLVQGAVVLDTSTSEPGTSQAMATLGKTHGFDFVDGPVSGGPAAANTGTMTMLLGGDATAIKKLRPVLDILTSKTVVVGGSGAGHAAKIVNNMLCAANLVLVAEAVRLGAAAGVRADDLLEGINAGSGRSGVSEVNFPKWVLNDAFDSGFTMGLMRKDVGLALKLAKTSGVDLAGFDRIADLWLRGSEHIPDEADFNAIVGYNEKGQTHG